MRAGLGYDLGGDSFLPSPGTNVSKNLLYYGDNLDVLRRHVKDESVDLVYLDPPFKSARDYNILVADQDGTRSPAQIQVFEDTWRWDQVSAAAYEEVVEAGGVLLSKGVTVLRVTMVLLLALLVVPGSALAQVHQKFKTFGEWHISPPDTNAMTDAVTHTAFTELVTEVEQEFQQYKALFTVVVNCAPDARTGVTSVVAVPGVAYPAKVRFRVDKNPAHEKTIWPGLESEGIAILAIPQDEMEAFLSEGRGASKLLVEANGELFEFSLVGFDEATDALQCDANEAG